jgi:acetyltransferase-like isoleucine patch superfamily enzyme
MKNLKIKYLFAKIIALLPTNIIRCYLYRKLLKYKIYKTYIGRKTVIAVDDAEFVECSIGGRNKFVGPMRITIGKGSTIGSKNDFNCGGWTKTEQFKSANYERCLDIGKETLITKNHYFDVAGLFAIGDYSCIAGINSQFWTHGAGVKDRNVTIGEHCYIGSAVRFAPGSSVGDNCIVGLGSVVTKSMITANNAIVAGHPAKVIRENYDWKTSMDI